MNANVLAKSFPPLIQLPQELRMLCDWATQNGYPISGYFELSRMMMRVYACGSVRKKQSATWHNLVPSRMVLSIAFGQQRDGREPIVHMGSEGQNNIVLASDTLGFLRLLAIGYDEIGFADLSSPPDGEHLNPAFQTWVTKTFNVSIPKFGNEITVPAQKANDNFQKWITPRCG
jgi:hypothetical protein